MGTCSSVPEISLHLKKAPRLLMQQGGSVLSGTGTQSPLLEIMTSCLKALPAKPPPSCRRPESPTCETGHQCWGGRSMAAPGSLSSCAVRGSLAKYWDQIPAGLDILYNRRPAIQRFGSKHFPWETQTCPLGGRGPILGFRTCGMRRVARGRRAHPATRSCVRAHSSRLWHKPERPSTAFYNASICDEEYEPIHKP
jgi:hypothetical protein